ncbi:hypothetical protein EXS70_01235 [Candidatus Peribacteria bacterium]|nr:hypothetical protein [Candidatus Peribacteria bacterium]
MRPIVFTVLASPLLLLTACVAPPRASVQQESSFASSSQMAAETASSSTQGDLFAMMPFRSSKPKNTGTGGMVSRIADRGILEIGMANAPLELTVFTHYSCRYCQEFSRDLLPRLKEEFVNDGMLRVRFVPTPLKKYPNSALEASAILCASVLGKGNEMHAAMTTAKLRDRKSLITLAISLKIPAADFTKCLAAKETKKLLAQQQALVTERNVTLIPTFILTSAATASGETITGLPSYADLRGWIRKEITD